MARTAPACLSDRDGPAGLPRLEHSYILHRDHRVEVVLNAILHQVGYRS